MSGDECLPGLDLQRRRNSRRVELSIKGNRLGPPPADLWGLLCRQPSQKGICLRQFPGHCCIFFWIVYMHRGVYVCIFGEHPPLRVWTAYVWGSHQVMETLGNHEDPLSVCSAASFSHSLLEILVQDSEASFPGPDMLFFHCLDSSTCMEPVHSEVTLCSRITPPTQPSSSPSGLPLRPLFLMI